MKVSCQSCGAKYTIADDKVRGRKVKIRCKSCGSPIVVDGQSEAPPPAAEAQAETAVSAPAPAATPDVWTVNLSDTDQRTMTTAEIVDGWRNGTVTSDAFVWKDGMGDWTAVHEHPDLKPLLSAPAAQAAPAPVAAAVTAAAAPASVGGAARLAGKGRSAATGAVDLFGGVDVAGSEEEEDVATSAPAVPQAGTSAYDDGKLTGARNENSVLFSLDALKGGMSAEPKKPAPSKPKASPLDFGGPDLMAGAAPNPIFNLNADQALLTAPAPPEPPPPKVVAASGAPSASGPNKTWIIGGAVGMVLLVGVAFALGRSGSSESEEAKDDGAKPTASMEAKTAEKEPAAEKKEEKEEPKADEPKAEASAAPVAPASAAPTTTGTAKPETTTPTDKKGTTTAPKETKKEEPAAAVATGPFSVSAAQVALTQAAGNAQACKKPGGPTGTGKVQVTFAPSGRVTSANVNGAPFAGTPVGGCVASAFRRARIPAFTGNPVTVSKSFSVR
jgi:predicted Zn finger-like uncharacterized protein